MMRLRGLLNSESHSLGSFLWNHSLKQLNCVQISTKMDEQEWKSCHFWIFIPGWEHLVDMLSALFVWCSWSLEYWAGRDDAGTPLWRNGPPEKPILCNACGSRWRTKGTLSNYTPLHARENIDLKEIRLPKIKPSEHKLHKRKQTDCNLQAEQEHEITVSDQNFHKALEEDTSNRSSSGSAISYSESCSHFGGVDGSDPTGCLSSSKLMQKSWI